MAGEFHDSNADEEDFIVELTRQMEDYMLHEDDDDDNNHNNTHVTCFVNQNQNQNQHQVNSKQGKWKKAESAQEMRYSRGRRVTYGSGMRAVFLNRPGSKTGYKGTGVFLPPSANCPTTHSRKISGWSTALVPTRVIEVLEQHFNNLKPLSPLDNLLNTKSTHQGPIMDYAEKKLPQEWTY